MGVAVPSGSSLRPTGQTRQVTVSSAAPSAVVATVFTVRVRVGEDLSVAGWPTTDYDVRKPGTGDDPRRVPAGGTYEFVRDGRPFYPGEIVGYLQTVSGTTTFWVDEEGL